MNRETRCSQMIPVACKNWCRYSHHLMKTLVEVNLYSVAAAAWLKVAEAEARDLAGTVRIFFQASTFDMVSHLHHH